MKAVLIAILVAAAGAGPAAAQPVYQQGLPLPPVNMPQPTYTVRDVVITRVHPLPPPSGGFHFYVVAEGRAPGPIDYEIQWTHFGADASGRPQFVPPVGSVCTFTFHYEAMRGVDVGRRRYVDYSRPSLVATGFACDTGSDPMFGPPDPPLSMLPPRDWEAMPQVAAVPAALLPTLEELPLPPVAGAPAGLRFRLLGALSQRDPGMCGDRACGARRFWYLLVWREGRPGSLLFQSAVAPAWRDLRIDGVTQAGSRLTVRISGMAIWEGRPPERTQLHAVAELP